MNCRDARELVHAYADDELDAVHVRDIDAHLELCERCRNVLEGVRATRTAAANPAASAAAATSIQHFGHDACN